MTAQQLQVSDWTSDQIHERYVRPAAQEMRRKAIQKLTDCGLWVEEAEYFMDTLFSNDVPTFSEFLEQHPDLACALWPVKRAL